MELQSSGLEKKIFFGNWKSFKKDVRRKRSGKNTQLGMWRSLKKVGIWKNKLLGGGGLKKEISRERNPWGERCCKKQIPREKSANKREVFRKGRSIKNRSS